MIVRDFTNALESFAPIEIQEAYDNCGLLTGNHKMEVKGVVITLDVTEEVINECINNGANLIVAHHPIIFGGIKKLTGGNYVEDVLIKAIKNDIAIYAFHTNLDKVQGGVSFKMAEMLGLQNVEILSPESDMIGLGAIGKLEKPLSTDSFIDLVKSIFGGVIRYTDIGKKEVNKVALCGGSGASFFNIAKSKEADVYLSSDFKYHQFFDAEKQTMIVDIGHAEAENCSKALINEILSKKFPNFAVYLSEVDTNPIKYY
jgi:dinuclear metal center YbgI/SA1388 family protein